MTQHKHKAWHSLSGDEVLHLQSSSPKGLQYGEVLLRQEKYGKNTFEFVEKHRFLKLLWSQIKSPLVFVLIIAGFITLFLGAYTDSIVILIAVSINTVIGIIQEGKASQSFSKLRDSQIKHSTVIREGKKQVIRSDELVPGDMLSLSAGDGVGADTRIIEGKGLEINEAVLTGEWMSVSKNNRKLKEKVLLPERSNMAWMGTLVTSGWATAIVVGTGFDTEIGKIARLIGKEKAPLTNFQKNIKKLAKTLGFLILGILALVFGLGILNGESLSTMFFTSIAVAVAAIPEGLPVAVSVVLAIGMERVLKKGGLVKKLNAAETLGSVDLILTDKTGTLTQAVMRISDILTLNSLTTKKEKEDQETHSLIKENKDKMKILEMSVLSTGGFIENPEDNLADWVVRGRPIEQAVVYCGIEYGFYFHELLKNSPRLDFLEFESERRFSASLHEYKNKNTMVLAGAPELILELSTKIYKDGQEINLTGEYRKLFTESVLRNASFGARIIAVAYKKTSLKEFKREKEGEADFSNLVFGGLVLLNDPIRPDVVSSLRKAEMAGIKTIMMTGDHKGTAQKIGTDVGILKKGESVATGDILSRATDTELKKTIRNISIFARVLPHQKLRVVKTWQELGKTVAMTGDGINDAPALRRSDIGIVVNSGTEVAKEASELVLLNNSFAVIVAAIEEGRRILINLRKILVYLLSTSFSEVVLITSSLAIGLPLPVLPGQILWANLIEEGFMNFAFAFEPKEKGIMNASPKDFSSKIIFTKESKKIIAILTFFTSIILLFVFLVSHLYFKNTLEYTRTIVFAVLSIDSIFFAFSLKNFKKPVWKINLLSNRYLIVAVFISLFFLVLALFMPQIRLLLSLEKLVLSDILLVLGIGFLNLFIIETVKHFLAPNKFGQTKNKKWG